MLEQYPLWTACVTPFTQQGDSVDLAGLQELVSMQQAHQIGVVLFGSTGEGLLLTEQEKKTLLTAVLAQALQVPVMVNLPNHAIETALSVLSFCETLPVSSYLIAPPVYTKPGVIGQTQWFKALLEHTQRPVVLYDIPSRTGVKLHIETLKALRGYDQIVAIKASSGSIDSVIQYITELETDWAILSGDDGLMPAMLGAGAQGLVSVATNACPGVVKHLLDHLLAGKRLNQLTLRHWYQLTQALMQVSNPIPIKALMKALGLIQTDALRLPLSIDDLPDGARETLLQNVKALNESYLC